MTLERMARMAGDAVEKGSRPEPAAAEILAVDDVIEPVEEITKAIPVPGGVFGEDHESRRVPSSSKKARISW